ncbi:S8 family peptidase [Bradyrhizobium manausense]|uniref:S8 family peptidase n=1 Tax=Bradyrhizobium manausense TaxID=989370 RepID=UPI001BAE043E|nr:S8 family peptidase [Bradyrhizobium manausense]MBR0690704.1 S8 family peptidase [Bradyrhizobium manausense]
MATFPHLPLERLVGDIDRRRAPNPVGPPQRAAATHAAQIQAGVDTAVAEQRAAAQVEGIDPELILKVSLAHPVQEDSWRTAGLKVLAQEPNDILVLFSDDIELREFRSRLAQYQAGTQEGRQNPAYNSIFASIDEIGSISASDRIGPRLRSDGIVQPNDISADADYGVDVELWDAPTQMDREIRVQCLVQHIESEGGEIQSRYIGTAGLIVLRARVRGTLLRAVLEMSAVSRVDYRPIPDLGERNVPLIPLEQQPGAIAPPADAPVIGVVDSGSVDHPLLASVLIESLGVPANLGTADIWGHGTKVAGIAAFGDVRECVDQGAFQSPVRLISVKVVNDQGQFDDIETIPKVMQQAIRALHERGCRIINISLGDKYRVPYDGGRVSQWSATLDELSRELDVVIIVSAGNSAGGAHAPWGTPAENIIASYPDYLVAPNNRIVDPATAAIALTVGSLAHANGLPIDFGGAELRAITSTNTPTPITRSGPGINASIKPDLVDFGGTCVFDGGTQRVAAGEDFASAGMFTLHADYVRGLLASATGTSMAAPRIAYKAALLLRALPHASANLVRALLAVSSSHPSEAVQKLSPLGEKAMRHCMGYGMPDLNRALNSEEARVIMFADRQELPIDQFALYRVPLPKEFQSTKGRRHIKVSLAFDPPVRHSRLEYLGLRMNYHLLRGMTAEAIIDHFRHRNRDEVPFEDLPGTAKCTLSPSRDVRGTSTLQCSTFKMTKNIDRYGDEYYLAVFAERRWAGEEVTHQRFAVAVELEHEAEINLYNQLRVRVRV